MSTIRIWPCCLFATTWIGRSCRGADKIRFESSCRWVINSLFFGPTNVETRRMPGFAEPSLLRVSPRALRCYVPSVFLRLRLGRAVSIAALLLHFPFHLQGVSVTPEELTVRGDWVAARFEGRQTPPPTNAALVVLANHGPVLKKARAGKPLRLAGQDFTRGLLGPRTEPTAHPSSRSGCRIHRPCGH